MDLPVWLLGLDTDSYHTLFLIKYLAIKTYGDGVIHVFSQWDLDGEQKLKSM
jgi:hypothetical protein